MTSTQIKTIIDSTPEEHPNRPVWEIAYQLAVQNELTAMFHGLEPAAEGKT